MVAPLITQGQLENRIGGPAKLVQLLDDNGDGVADAGLVAEVLEEATQLGVGLLWDGFPTYELVALLVANDLAIVGAFCDIACGLAGQRRIEFTNPQGLPVFDSRRKQGEKVLAEIARAKRRASGEEQAGRNSLLHARRSRNVQAEPFIFAKSGSDPNDRGPGGYAWAESADEVELEQLLRP